MQVLLVEDNESTRTLLDAVLASRNHVATTCADAESALAAYSPERFPLVVLDWLLPGMDGLELCRRIRSDASPARGLMRHPGRNLKGRISPIERHPTNGGLPVCLRRPPRARARLGATRVGNPLPQIN